ncbi:MAG: class IV adenylate cyclase [Staphylothermus sp.]|nr:class IV adenylate cyclase [Staphylothermus sp.]
MENYEIEAKYKIKDLEKVLNYVTKKLGLREYAKCIETDYYFNHPCKDFKQTDEALRTRRIVCQGIESIVLTYKGPKEHSELGIKKRIEIETYVSDLDKILMILEKLGFRKVIEFSKERTTYKNNNLVITIDKLYGIGIFMEIETNNVELIHKIREELAKYIEPETKTYLEICLETQKCTSARDL